MAFYLNTFETYDNYKNKLKNIYVMYETKPIPIILYSSILSLFGLTTFEDENNHIHLPLYYYQPINHGFRYSYIDSTEGIEYIFCNSKIYVYSCDKLKIIDDNTYPIFNYNTSIYYNIDVHSNFKNNNNENEIKIPNNCEFIIDSLPNNYCDHLLCNKLYIDNFEIYFDTGVNKHKTNLFYYSLNNTLFLLQIIIF